MIQIVVEGPNESNRDAAGKLILDLMGANNILAHVVCINTPFTMVPIQVEETKMTALETNVKKKTATKEKIKFIAEGPKTQKQVNKIVTKKKAK